MRIRTLPSVAACAVFVAACGSGSHASGHSRYGPRSSPYALSECMRANGLTNFPDPTQGSGGLGFPGGVIVSIEGDLTVDGTTFTGPALKRASQRCRTYLPPTGPPPRLSEQQETQMLRLARCMRAHGVPNFPDPGSPARVNGAIKAVPIPGSNSPAFDRAAKVCGGSHASFRPVGSNIQGRR